MRILFLILLTWAVYGHIIDPETVHANLKAIKPHLRDCPDRPISQPPQRVTPSRGLRSGRQRPGRRDLVESPYFNERFNICPEVIPGQDRLALFPARSYGTTLVPRVPQYPFRGCDGVWCWMDGLSPVPPFTTNPYAPYPAPNASDPSTFIPAALGQVRLVQQLTVTEFGSASLNWTNDIINVHLSSTPIPNGPNVYQAVVQATGAYMNQVALPPTLLTEAVGPYQGAIPGFFTLFVPKAFDSTLARTLTDRYQCTMPRAVFASPLCPKIFGFSQARVDWNIFRTSTITALNTNGTDLPAQWNSIMACLDDLLAQAFVPYTRIIRVLISLAGSASDEASEAQVRSLWLASPFVTNGWLPTRSLDRNITLLDPKALVGVAIEEAFAGANYEELRAYNDHDVFSLPDEYNQLIMTPAGFAYTSQLGPTTNSIGTNITINNDGTPFYFVLNQVDPSLRAELAYFLPDETVQGSIYANWVAQQVQVFINAGIVLARAQMTVTDIVYQYNRVGTRDLVLPFFPITDAATIIYNSTEGKSGLSLPQRDDTIDSDQPFYLGALPYPFSYYGTTHTSDFIGLDRRNVVVRANNNGATPGVTQYIICDGTTDITTCPYNLEIDLGAKGVPIVA